MSEVLLQAVRLFLLNHLGRVPVTQLGQSSLSVRVLRSGPFILRQERKMGEVPRLLKSCQDTKGDEAFSFLARRKTPQVPREDFLLSVRHTGHS